MKQARAGMWTNGRKLQSCRRIQLQTGCRKDLCRPAAPRSYETHESQTKVFLSTNKHTHKIMKSISVFFPWS